MEGKTFGLIWETDLATSEKMVLLALAQLGDKDGVSWCGQKTLSEMTGLSIASKSITRIINKLEKDNNIIVWRQQGRAGGRGYTHIYMVVIGFSDDEILEIVMRRFNASYQEAQAILSQSGPIFEELVRRNRISDDTLLSTKHTKKGVVETPIKGVVDTPKPKRVYEMPEKGVPDTPDLSKDLSNINYDDKDARMRENSNLTFRDFQDVFETEIGVLSPLIKDQFDDYLKDCPVSWLIEAVEIAASSNARKASYVYGVLKRSIELKQSPKLAGPPKPSRNGAKPYDNKKRSQPDNRIAAEKGGTTSADIKAQLRSLA